MRILYYCTIFKMTNAQNIVVYKFIVVNIRSFHVGRTMFNHI